MWPERASCRTRGSPGPSAGWRLRAHQPRSIPPAFVRCTCGVPTRKSPERTRDDRVDDRPAHVRRGD